MEDLDALCAAVLACEGKDVVDLLGVLLRWCRDHEPSLRAAYDRTPARQRMLACETYVTGGFRFARDISAADLLALAAVLRSYASDPGTPSTAARGAAVGIHKVSRREIHAAFQEQGTKRLAPHDPFPVAVPPLKEIFGKQLNSSPERFSEATDSLPTLRLAPPDLAPYEVKFVWERRSVFKTFSREAPIAAVLPNTGLHELTWERFTRDGERRFYGARPRDRDGQRARILALLREADEAGAKIAVLPELCVDAGLIDDVRRWWPGAKSLKLLVAGSHHPEAADPAERRNVAVTMTPWSEAEHHKYNRFDFPDLDDDGQAPSELRTEDICTTPPRITVHMSGNWSYTTVICKDLIDQRAIDLLVQLRVKLVLVPSCSAKTAAFETRVRQLATDAQSIVVLGNTPGAEDAAAAIFGRPTLNEPLLIRTGQDIPLPVTWIFILDGNLHAKKIT